MDKVSIITTYYNASEFIVTAVNSIAQQETDGSFEIEYVLVDDCSTDNSTEAIKAYAAKYGVDTRNWKFIRPEHNLGCGGARRYGIEHATGNYFMFLDADDYYIKRDFVKRAHETISVNKADIVEYGMQFNRANSAPTDVVAPRRCVMESVHDKEVALFKNNLIKFNVWTKIYTRKVVESYPYSDARTFEDVRTIPVWVANANFVIIEPTVEVNYRAASGSIIRDDLMKTRLGTITAISEHFERFKDDFDILKAMYGRAMVDLEATLHNHSSENEGFIEMCRLNTKMLKYIYPDTYQNITCDIDAYVNK